jgi:UDP-2,3-diacylglucosamine hydrolase
MRTLFISDLHLEDSRPDITALFLAFLEKEASYCDALYILGDLFEAFIGDDENTALHQKVSNALSSLNKKGVPIYLMHGNRDFLIGKSFIRRSQVTLIADPTIIDLYGRKTLLMHGDTLCTQDINYLTFRKKARNPLLKRLFLALPLKKRQALAEKARAISKTHTHTVDMRILDVTPAEIPLVMEKYHVQQLIHGHTHCPGFHYFWRNGQLFSRYTLSDWEKTGHFFTYDHKGSSRLQTLSRS